MFAPEGLATDTRVAISMTLFLGKGARSTSRPYRVIWKHYVLGREMDTPIATWNNSEGKRSAYSCFQIHIFSISFRTQL